MPNIKSAKKKLRKDKKRTAKNSTYKEKMRKLMKKTKNTDTKSFKEIIRKTFSVIDKAAKKKIIHKNKAARLKSRLSQLLKKTA